MLKALVYSSFIIATAVGVNQGYARLLETLDAYMHRSYGTLAEQPQAELQQSGNEVLSSYQRHRSEQ